MSVPPEVIQQMMGQPGGAASGPPGSPPPSPAGAPGGQPGAPAGGAPAAAPVPQPQQKEGLKAAAQTNVHIAVNMLEEALPAFGSESKEGEKIIKALGILSPMLAKRDSSDLVPAEVLQMVRQLPQMGGGTDVQKMLMQQMQKPQGQPGQPGQAPQQPPRAA